MRRYVAHLCALTVIAAVGVPACSEDGPAAPSGSSSEGVPDGGVPHGGEQGSGGDSEGKGGSNASHAGNNTGPGGAALGGESNEGGELVGGGGAAGGGGGDAGHGGDVDASVGGEPAVLAPDLIVSSGGPWPDSFTAACSTDQVRSACPRVSDPFFGQDGTYRINVPSYETTSSTVRDEITNLVWQKLPSPEQRDHAAAVDYCDGLELAEQTDWRLPTRLEYISLLDEGQGVGTALPAAFSPDTSGQYWTASSSGVTAGTFFVVNDSEGKWNVAVDATPFGVRCVRGSSPAGEQRSKDGTVEDSMTQLTWQADMLSDAAHTWGEALAYCEGLSFAGKEDWRLPSIKELATIIDEAAVEPPVVRAVFSAVPTGRYWSSTPAPSFGGPALAFTLETSLGISPSLKMTDRALARCVRTTD